MLIVVYMLNFIASVIFPFMKNLYLLLVLFVNKKIQYTRLPFFIYTDSVRKNEKRAPKKETDQEPWPRQYVLVLLIAAYEATSEQACLCQEMRYSRLSTYLPT